MLFYLDFEYCASGCFLATRFVCLFDLGFRPKRQYRISIWRLVQKSPVLDRHKPVKMQECVVQWDGCKVITVCLAFDLRCQSQKPQRERQRVGLLVPNSRQQLLRSFSLPHHLPCPFYALVTLSLVHCHKNNKNVIIIRTRGDQRLQHTGSFDPNSFQTDLNIEFSTRKYLQFCQKNSKSRKQILVC